MIAAGLSIQDPRESPAEARQAADRAARALPHRSATPTSSRSSSCGATCARSRRRSPAAQFRKRCKAELLHFLRIREWQDLVGQLRQAAKAAGVAINAAPAEPEQIHRALLAGLLSHVGVRDAAPADARATGAGAGRWSSTRARAARASRCPRGATCRRGRPTGRWSPSWSRRRGCGATRRRGSTRRGSSRSRRAAAALRVRRAALGPRRGAAVVDERVTLYGLPIVVGRPVPYARVDPAAARELFLRRALVGGRVGDAPRLPRRERAARRRGRGAGGPLPPSRPARRRGDALPLLRQPRAGGRRRRARRSSAGGARRAGAIPSC